MKKLKNILLATTFGLSFGLNLGYSQNKGTTVIAIPISSQNPNTITSPEYVNKKSFKKNGETYNLIGSFDANGTKYLQYSNLVENKKNPNLLKTSQSEWEKAYEKNSKAPDYLKTTTNKNLEFGETLLYTGATLGALWLINELTKPRNKAPVNNSNPLINNSPNTNYNSNTGNSNKDWWKEDFKEKLKDNQIKNAGNAVSNWRDENKTKSENSLENKIKYSPETKKQLEKEAKIADEYFKEIGMNPGEQVKYKVVGTSEIGPNGEIIKKDSYSPERELTDEEKVILYYAYNLSKNHSLAGPVIKGVETANKLEKDVDFLFAKPIGENNYYYFKLAGKEDYVVMKNSPFGNQIINITKDFKEKVKKTTEWWDK